MLRHGERVVPRPSREKRFGTPIEVFVSDRPARLGEFRQTRAPLRHIPGERDVVAGDLPGYADDGVFGLSMWARCVSDTEPWEPADPVFRWRERLPDAFGGLARSAPGRAA